MRWVYLRRRRRIQDRRTAFICQYKVMTVVWKGRCDLHPIIHAESELRWTSRIYLAIPLLVLLHLRRVHGDDRVKAWKRMIL